MDNLQLQLLADLYKSVPRQGPGGIAETRQAMNLAGLDRESHLKIADIGCGTGSSSLVLAKESNVTVTAVDFISDFLDIVQQRAESETVANQINTLECSMDSLPFTADEFDVIWSEGAIYNMGFEAGISAWKKFLKSGGKLIVSEITWLTDTRPQQIQSYWEEAYPQIDTAAAKIKILEQNGYSPEAYFTLPQHCWLENFYEPLQKGFEDFLRRHNHSNQATTIIEETKKEIELYKKYSSYYSYGVYIAKKI